MDIEKSVAKTTEGYAKILRKFPNFPPLAKGYVRALETEVMLWINDVVCDVFQQDSAPAHKARKTQLVFTATYPTSGLQICGYC